MLRRTWNVVPVRIQGAHEKDTVVIVYNIIGNIVNCQDVSFQKMLRKHSTGPLRTSSKSGVRSWEKNRFPLKNRTNRSA
jgi:hypothetical protein